MRVEGRQEQVYTFKHNITREVAYGTLLEEQQRDLHWAVGSAIEARTPEAIDLLAHHFYRSDTRRPEQRARALHYLGAAADHALLDYANDTAVTQFARAHELESAPGLPARPGARAPRPRPPRRPAPRPRIAGPARRRTRLCACAAWGEYAEAIGDYDRAESAFAEALAIARSAGDTIQQAQALTRQGMVAWRRGDYQAAEAHFESTLALLAGSPAGGVTSGPVGSDTSPEAADALDGLGLVYRQTGRYDEARAALARDLAAARCPGPARARGAHPDADGPCRKHRAQAPPRA